AGSLPAGLSLSSGGVLSGTPSAAGNSTLTVTATDSSGGTAATVSHAFTLTVAAAAVVAPVANGTTQAIAYNSGTAGSTAVTLSLAGGTATSVAIATTPAHGTVTVSGMSVTYLPNANYVGTDSFAYTASNSGGTSAPATVTLTIAAPSLTAAAAAPVTLTENSQSASFAVVTVTGGVAPLVYSVSPVLPAGLSLNSAEGQISGSPTVSVDDAVYTMTITDGAGQPSGVVFHLTVRAPVATVSVTPATLPAARQGSVYSVTFSATGGA